jgi:hypothetical protein
MLNLDTGLCVVYMFWADTRYIQMALNQYYEARAHLIKPIRVIYY